MLLNCILICEIRISGSCAAFLENLSASPPFPPSIVRHECAGTELSWLIAIRNFLLRKNVALEGMEGEGSNSSRQKHPAKSRSRWICLAERCPTLGVFPGAGSGTLPRINRNACRTHDTQTGKYLRTARASAQQHLRVQPWLQANCGMPDKRNHQRCEHSSG